MKMVKLTVMMPEESFSFGFLREHEMVLIDMEQSSVDEADIPALKAFGETVLALPLPS